MKHLLLILTLLLGSFSAMPAMAQKGNKNYAQRSVHMSHILCLDDAIAARFSPLYEKYRKEMNDARQKYKKIKPQKNKDGKPQRLTEEQVKKNIETSFALSQSILDIRKKYYKEFLKILPPRQIERLYELEKKDGEQLRKMVQKNKKKK